MRIKGKIIQSIPETSGIGKASGKTWRKKEYVLETEDKYPKKICFTFFNDTIDKYPLAVGQYANIGIDLESREYGGKWYHSIVGLNNSERNMGVPAASQPELPQEDDESPF